MNKQKSSFANVSSPGSHDKCAVVIGGSLAGLLAARVLANHFDKVSVLERDCLSDEPGPRQGVPQARHLHVLLARGRQILEQLFPGLVEELTHRGAPVADMAMDLAWLTPAGWGARCDSGIRIVGCSRDLLEWSVRRRLAQIPNVRFIGDCDVTGLESEAGRNRVCGVRLRDNALKSDLVVDASGRGSRAPQWLQQLGYEPPAETVVNAFLGYTSRVYKRHPTQRDWQGVYVQPSPPDCTRGGALFPVEGDGWILTLAGYGRDYPPTDEAGFLEFARSLPTTLIYHAVREAKPLSDIFTYRATENRLRHYERMSRMPEGFVVLGDAACAFNPVYAQGMTMAALGAITLDECLLDLRRRKRDGDSRGLARRFQKKLAKVNTPPWMLATSEDFRVRGCEGEPPGRIAKVMQLYFDNVVRLSTRNSYARRLLLEVFNMLKPPGALFQPRMLFKVLVQSSSLSSQSELRGRPIEEAVH